MSAGKGDDAGVGGINAGWPRRHVCERAMLAVVPAKVWSRRGQVAPTGGQRMWSVWMADVVVLGRSAVAVVLASTTGLVVLAKRQGWQGGEAAAWPAGAAWFVV